MDEYLKSMSDLLEVDSVSLGDELRSFDCWDSLTILSIIAYVKDRYKISVSAKQIEECCTVGDIYEKLISKTH